LKTERRTYVIKRLTKGQYLSNTEKKSKGGKWVDKFEDARLFGKFQHAKSSLAYTRKYEPSSYIISCTVKLESD